ncbi:MAG: glycosyltransferase [Verrucomicrobia bacterium]|nr:glycosyltransferase [Verrucomicrobiota bacterium]
MGPLPETSLIITAHRHGPMLEKCLDAVAALDPAPGETIVVVDGNDQAVAKSAQRRGFETIVLPNAPGVSAARNAGAARAKGIFLLFLDSDVVPRRDHVAKAVSALGTIPGAVAAFGCYDDSPAAPGVVSRYRNLLHHFTHFHANRDAQSFWAACGICDAEVFRQVGGFDETYRVPSIEDIALGYKLRRAGHRIALDPSWQVKHLKQWIWRDLVVTDIARRAIPWTLLLLREGRLDNDLNIDTRSRWSALLVAAALAFLTLSILQPWLLAAPAAFLAAAIFLNRRFYRFLANHGGWPFAIRAIPLHLFYYFAAMIGWVSGHAIFLFQRILGTQ